ncbi:MAG: DNA primase [Methylococcales bacterium]|nr:DNA primase [Methylococcales bacterium]
MAGFIPREFITDLLIRVDIIDLINAHVPLKKTGLNFMARCPFHDEKTPSFAANAKRQTYHCFGCGLGGNAISFLMEYSNLDFIEAVEDLASFMGIDVPYETHGNYTPKTNPDTLKPLYSTLEAVAKFYAQQLKSNAQGQKAIAYLKNRGVSGIVARDFMLGYSPDEWNQLSQYFNKKLLMDTGLLVEKEQRRYDRFRGRLMFPIRDKRGRVLGFGARVLDDSMPKYLNSPETEVFSKSNEVYGLYELLQHNNKPDRILIVEGYMDVIALAQFKIYYAIATLGTATSQKLLEVLFRYSTELVFCFDGDKAGIKAAWRAIETAMPTLKDGRYIKVMLLPQGDDPDSLIRREGLETFEQRVLSSQTLSDYFFEHLSKNLNLATMEGRSSLVTHAQPHLQKIPNGIFKKMMQARLQTLSELAKDDAHQFAPISNQRNPQQQKNKISLARYTIALLIQNTWLSQIAHHKISYEGDFNFPAYKVFKSILNTILDKKPATMGLLLEYYRETKDEKIINTLAAYDLNVDNASNEIIEKIFIDSFNNLIKYEQETHLNSLLIKEKQQQLTVEEKETLLTILGKNN